MSIKKFFIFLFFLPIVAFGDMKPWQIIPNESHITFTATQNGAPATGEFKKFSGDIVYDPADLTNSHVKITVDLASVFSTYDQLADTLKTKEWFDLVHSPQAIFTAKDFKKINDKNYQANGTLTINGKTVPIVLTYTQENYSNDKALIKGSTQIKRTNFNVGQGEWADTKTIKDDVKIDFVVSAKK